MTRAFDKAVYFYYISRYSGESLMLPGPMEMFPFCFEESIIQAAGRSLTGRCD